MGLLNLFTGFRGPRAFPPWKLTSGSISSWHGPSLGVFLSFAAAQRILLDCSGTMRILRVLPDFRKAQSSSLLPCYGHENLRPLLRHLARRHYRLPLRLLLSP